MYVYMHICHSIAACSFFSSHSPPPLLFSLPPLSSLFCTAPPAPPTDVTLHVTSNRSLTVTFSEPEETNGATVTRYKSEYNTHVRGRTVWLFSHSDSLAAACCIGDTHNLLPPPSLPPLLLPSPLSSFPPPSPLSLSPRPVEWCRSEKFAPIVGEFVMMDLRSTEYIIPDLNKVRGCGIGGRGMGFYCNDGKCNLAHSQPFPYDF